MPFIDEPLTANGTTSLGRIVAAKAILDIILNDQVLTLAVNAGGTGYVVGETFDVDGGTVIASNSAFNARGIVVAEAAGVVTSVKITSAGAYSTLPGLTGQTTSNASAAGTGLTVDLTTQVNQWTQDRNTYVDDATDFEWIATSIKTSNKPTIGLDTAQTSGNGYNRVLVATGFNSGSVFNAQPGASPSDVTLLNVPGTDPRLYVSVDERRVNMCHRDGNFVQYGTAGLFIPFTDTDANYPFPGAAFGQSRAALAFASSMVRNQASPNASNAGVVHSPPNAPAGTLLNPHYYRDNLSTTWFAIAELTATDGYTHRGQIWPQKQGYQDYTLSFAPQVSSKETNPQSSSSNLNPGILADNNSSSDTGWFEDNDGSSLGVQGVAPLGAGSRLSFVVQPHIIANTLAQAEAIGIIDGYQAVHGIGLTAFEEIITESGQRFMVFPDTNTSEAGKWTAMEKI